MVSVFSLDAKLKNYSAEKLPEKVIFLKYRKTDKLLKAVYGTAVVDFIVTNSKCFIYGKPQNSRNS